jgi:hypothetical protein
MAKAARSKKAWFQKPLQVIRHQRLTDLCRPRKNVLTAKKGLFLAVLAGKRGVGRAKKHFILHFFTFWWFFAFACCCPAASCRFRKAPKKIVPKNLQEVF